MRTFPDRANKVTLPVVARADGSPITAGTVNFYLIDDDGPNAGKWFRGSDDSWQAAEAVAGAATHKADGHWQRSIEAAAWKNVTSYTLYAKESGNLHIPLSTQVLCRYGAPFDYPSDSNVFVAPASTHTDRAANLAAAIDLAAALTPGGDALDAGNHATVWMLPGCSETASGITVPPNIDLIALHPMEGGHRCYTDVDEIDGTTSLEQYRPPKTEIRSKTGGVTTLTIQGPDTLTRGFGVGQISGDATGSYHAVYYSDADPVGTTQDMMYYWHRAPNTTAAGNERYPNANKGHVKGSSTNCIANSCAWRILKTGGTTGAEFSLTGWWLEAGGRSFGGDHISGDEDGHQMNDCFLDHCVSFGGFGSETYGAASFGGCSSFGLAISSTCVFRDTWNGLSGYGLGKKVEGTFLRAFGMGSSFAATTDQAWEGEFAGLAIDSFGRANSFGGTIAGPLGKLSGTLIRSAALGCSGTHQVEGAVIVDSLIEVTTANVDALTLLDGNSKVTGSTLLVGGTGKPINAASALDVAASRNAYNNSAAASEGLGTNVTNVGATDGSISILPYASTIANDGSLTARPLTVYQHATQTWTIAILDDDDAAVDLSGKDIALIAWLESADTAAVVTLTNYDGDTDIAIGGANNNQLAITIPTDDTGTAQVLKYCVRNMSDDTALAAGKLTIETAVAAPAVP